MNLKLVSTNIRFENPQDGPNDWPNRKDSLAELINHFCPDIIGSQEGREAQLRDFEKILDGLNLVEQHRQWIDKRMYPCLYINHQRFQIIKSGDIWLSETPDIAGSCSFESSFPRLCTWGHLKDKNSAHELIVANVHLDHVLDHTRERQAEVMAYQLNKINEKKGPLLLMGDFNAAPDSEVRDILTNGPLRLYDPWEKLGHEEESSYHKFKGYLPEGKRIDWFLLSDHFEPHQILLDKSSKNEIYPSDHFPVKLEVEVKS